VDEEPIKIWVRSLHNPALERRNRGGRLLWNSYLPPLNWVVYAAWINDEDSNLKVIGKKQ